MRFFMILILAAGLAACRTVGGLDWSFAKQKGLPADFVVKSKSGGCDPKIEDFENWVSGADECLAIKVFRSRDHFSGPPTLIVAVHGDGASGPAADSAPEVWNDQIRANILHLDEFKNSDTLIVVIARLGYPIYGVGRSSGHRPEPNGRRATYTPDYATPVIRATERLANKYGAIKVVGWGSSGGSATLAIGAALMHSVKFDKLLLGVCPCDVPTWESLHGWDYSAAHNPLNYAGKIPHDTEVVLIVGNKDTNTLPGLSETFMKARQTSGGAVRIVYTDGGHSSTKDTGAHVKEQIKTF